MVQVSKEWILNSATNRFQLNFSRNVGKVSEEIRNCSPISKKRMTLPRSLAIMDKPWIYL
jgi:hypothetical protein